MQRGEWPPCGRGAPCTPWPAAPPSAAPCCTAPPWAVRAVDGGPAPPRHQPLPSPPRARAPPPQVKQRPGAHPPARLRRAVWAGRLRPPGRLQGGGTRGLRHPASCLRLPAVGSPPAAAASLTRLPPRWEAAPPEARQLPANMSPPTGLLTRHLAAKRRNLSQPIVSRCGCVSNVDRRQLSQDDHDRKMAALCIP